ncbi:energy-coupling factor transporter transmembrane protein EcfT [Demequina capsici]|uniref:Energy-coupling factor transporter transmembrane protein EcfT n=1 Tax=Demequina capsici TaxID=3075620 RepID=A0AA96F9P7_9MICO|nr:energy-coupling factor transporter transmembrane protein EcfT [Demequina sp. PMTSA13]WNM26109.1 energy-coupling factor transporter transmembrane protein EcfT [Demequina sp. PMTSA13]
MNPTLGNYRPLRTPLHLAPAWFKVLLLAAVSVLMVLVQDVATGLAFAAASLALYLSTMPPWKVALKAILWTTLFAAMAAGYQLWRGELRLGLDIATDLFTVVFLALAVSSSTPMSEMLDLISGLLRPLRRFVPHETIGLMFSLLIRLIPEMIQILGQSRQAAMARGAERSPRAILVPAATRTVGFAVDLGQALHARGIADEATEDHSDELTEEIPQSRRARRAVSSRRARQRRAG